MTEKVKKLYILDGNYYIYRAFYGNQYMSTADGFPTGCLFSFTRMLQRFIARERPDYLAVCFDKSRTTFRTEMYAEYKANRNAPPEDMLLQIPRIRDVVRAHNIPVLEKPGFEADDLIATLTKRARAEGIEVVVVSADKDLMQILDEGTTLLDTAKDKIIRVEDVIARFQVPPEKVVDVLALAGDTSDNIPGVPGIGEKTAGKLIAEFGSLEAVLSNIDKVSGKKRKENLTEFADQARLSRRLVALKDDVEMDVTFEALLIEPPDFDALEKLYREFEFFTLLRGLDEKKSAPEKKAIAHVEKSFRAVTDVDDLDAVIASIEARGLCSVSIHLVGGDMHNGEIVGLALAWEEHAAVYLPLAHRYIGAPTQIPRDVALERLRPTFESETIAKIGHHIQHTFVVLRRYGIGLNGVKSDVMLAAYLLDSTKKVDPIEAVANDQLNMNLKKYSDIAGKGRKQVTMDMVDVERATDFVAERADAVLLLHNLFWPRVVEDETIRRLHDELELPLAALLGRVAMHGVLVDVTLLNTLSARYDEELTDLQTQIREAAGGEEFNINSPAQLRTILFEKLELPVLKRTKSGPSTDQSVLEQLKDEHPLPALILEYRSFAKLKSTYVDALPLLIATDGRIHCDLNQAVAATGRLSSSNPNLQNIPVRTARGREIRTAFVPPEGWSLLAADYSQVELRILAHLSEDEAFVDAFTKGQDVHARTAAEIFSVPVSEVTKQQRGVGKTINFGVIYGMGAKRLARDLEISHGQAEAYIEAYFERYAAVRDYFDDLVLEANKTGYANTMFGRRRPIPELTSSNNNLRAFGERTAINTPIQGTAADIIKYAMLAVQKKMEEERSPALMILQVHDELVFEVRDDVIEEFGAMVQRTMREVVSMKVPLVVDLGVGKTWLDCK